MINRSQVDANGFVIKDSGGVEMSDAARKEIITAWQRRKQEEITHPFLREAIPIGLIPYTQDLLLARHVRGGLEAYPAFFWRLREMLVLVSYDVSTKDEAGRRRLWRVARTCEDFGQRVQNSVFECLVVPLQWTALRSRLVKEAEPVQDSLRFYFLGAEWKRKVEHIGTKTAYDPEGALIL